MGCLSSDGGGSSASPVVSPSNEGLLKIVNYPASSQAASNTTVVSQKIYSAGVATTKIAMHVSGGGGLASTAEVTFQFDSTLVNQNRPCNYYQWTLQEDEAGNNVFGFGKSVQTGPSSCAIDSPATMSINNPGRDVVLRMVRDTHNVTFEYSVNNGATFQTANSFPLSSFNNGTMKLIGAKRGTASFANCADLSGNVTCEAQ